MTHWIFLGGKESRLIGLHPGMEVYQNKAAVTSPAGEAAVLMLTRDAALVPVEVKRTSTGFTDEEVGKLDTLTTLLEAPWSVVEACQYAHDMTANFIGLQSHQPDSGYARVALSYDAILDPTPRWPLGGDPFEWKPLTSEEIQSREDAFVRRLADQADLGPYDWLADHMLRTPTVRD
ncbi:hypothetical protein [Cryobacterium sp. CG_9.6]|uniref:hypothetical protein n=1 Tax=Cryobacterium sp. CG_9.6 TaxID=2760710 RepID=UPI002472F9D2|nr:hypothetical protein [Cryobacterium sp. CG_9.6]MDH6238457.1 hypothetical protein [Cryobacterium sp. CG_9.6]